MSVTPIKELSPEEMEQAMAQMALYFLENHSAGLSGNQTDQHSACKNWLRSKINAQSNGTKTETTGEAEGADRGAG